MASLRNDNTLNQFPKLKKNFVYGGPANQKKGDYNFSGFEIQARKAAGLTDATNISSNHGYVNKIRRDSLSGKPKEMKVSLVAHNRNISFKPSNSAKRNSHKDRAEKKPFSVKLPDTTQPLGMSPMDVDEPLVKIRNLMTCVPHGVVDIDAVCDPLRNTDYAQDICDYLQALERRCTVPKNYLHENKDITPNMRALLMDWLIQVQVHQELSQYTLHLCVNLVDQFVCKQHIQLHMFQLVGITAMLISAKYYERFPPEITDLCHLTDDTYSPTQVLKMERQMLRRLDFSLNIPGPVVFLERFLLVNPCDKKHLIQSMSMFLLDLTVSDLAFVHIYPSILAASAIYVSRELLGCQELWNKAFAYYTKYSEKDLQACSRALRHLLAKMHRSKLKGAHGKYTHSTFHGISNHTSVMHISLHPTELWPEQDMAESSEVQQTFV